MSAFIKCETCGRFMSGNDLEGAVRTDVWPSDPYEPPYDGYVHRACAESDPYSKHYKGETVTRG